MSEPDMKFDTVVIGAGQAGLAIGYYLNKKDAEFAIIDENPCIGDQWRNRWDSLKLFTPQMYNQLPGLSLRQQAGTRTSKDDMAGYLEDFAINFKLPVLPGRKVLSLDREGSGFRLTTSNGIILSKNVVIATGGGVRKIPAFAAKLNSGILQLHSADYKNAASLPDGDVLVVGAAASGIEIALELAEKRATVLAGQPSKILPKLLFQLGKFQWWLSKNVLTTGTLVGRKVRPGFIKGGAILPMLYDRLEKSAVIRRPRITGVKGGLPQFSDGKVCNPRTIIWCTGYQADYDWINFPLKHEFGWPAAHRGVVSEIKGLYFLGMPFQYNATSHLVYGVGPDAKFISDHLLNND